jgi:hypothetical protein
MNAIAAAPTTAGPAALDLLPATARFGIAVAVALVLSIAWIGAQHESHDAVLVAGNTLSSRITHITLPTVQVIGKRAAARTSA